MLRGIFGKRYIPEVTLTANADKPLPEFGQGQRILSAHAVWARGGEGERLAFCTLNVGRAAPEQKFWINMPAAMTRAQADDLVAALKAGSDSFSQTVLLTVSREAALAMTR